MELPVTLTPSLTLLAIILAACVGLMTYRSAINVAVNKAFGRNRRWSDVNHRFGPFTYSPSTRAKGLYLSAMLDSGDSDESPGCHARFSFGGHTLLIELPGWGLRPWSRKVIANWDAATVQRLGRNWYSDTHRREFGFTYGDGYLHLHYGPQTHDSTTTKSICRSLPWTQWHHHRFSFHGLQGEKVAEWIDSRDGRGKWDEQRDFKKTLDKAVFTVQDSDGEYVQATTHIEQREWTFGEGWCRWMRFFRKNRVSRSLAIEFSQEVGPEKGSWKGGLCGTGISLLPGELHEAAFRRFCDQQQSAKYGSFSLRFIGRVVARVETYAYDELAPFTEQQFRAVAAFRSHRAASTTKTNETEGDPS